MNKSIEEINSGKGFLTLPKIDNNVLDFISLSISKTLEELINKNQLHNKICNKGINSYKYLSNNEWTSRFNKRSRSFKRICNPNKQFF